MSNMRKKADQMSIFYTLVYILQYGNILALPEPRFPMSFLACLEVFVCWFSWFYWWNIYTERLYKNHNRMDFTGSSNADSSSSSGDSPEESSKVYYVIYKRLFDYFLKWFFIHTFINYACILLIIHSTIKLL